MARPIGSKNSKNETEKKAQLLKRKNALRENFQRYKNENHIHLKQLYRENYQKNKDKKKARVLELYYCKKHIKGIMNMSIF